MKPRALTGSRRKKMFWARFMLGARLNSWCTMLMPLFIASSGLAKATGAPAKIDLTGVRLVNTADDVHQGRFAGAVFSHQGVYLARLYAETDLFQDVIAGETLVDLFDFQDRRHNLLPGLVSAPVGIDGDRQKNDGAADDALPVG